MKERDDRILLERIIEAINIVKDHLAGYDFDKFSKDQKTYDAVLMQIVNIGELIYKLGREFHEEHHQLPWHKATGMRNQIAHGYFEIKKDVMWDTATKDLPELKKQVEVILG